MTTNNRTDAELWKALEELEENPLDERIPLAAIHAELQAAGVDPRALANEGLALVAAMKEEQRLAWRRAALQKKNAFASAARPQRVVTRPREEVLAHLSVLRKDPRLGPQVSMAFRSRKPEESSLEELEGIVDDIEALRSLGTDDEEK